MENHTPRKKLSAGFWIGMSIAVLITFLVLGVAGYAVYEVVRNRNIAREQVEEVSKVALQDDDQRSKPEPVFDEGTPIFTVVEEMPQFVGGDEARIKFLSDHIRYPQQAKEEGIMGTVYISFVIDENGRVSDAKILRGIGGGCDEEALRVVRLMPRWKPGKQSGKNVRVQFNMPIKFTLD